MKMRIKNLGVMLGLLHVIYAVPTGYTEYDPGSDIQEEGEPSENFKKEVEKYLKENSGPQLALMEEQVEDGEPSENFKDEVREYFKENGGPQMAFREEVEVEVEVEGNRDLRQGDTIALQTHIKEKWLSCFHHVCTTMGCPGAIFEGRDWENCRGEVFQIYKPTPGVIRSGDIVGLHYPLQHGTWVGCLGNHCYKTACPGNPSTQHGFATEDSWYQCYGEVYRIYAYRKNTGAIVQSGDDIMLYFLNSRKWVNGEGVVEGNNPCPGSRPLLQHKLDICPHEVFTVIKR